MQQYVNEKKEMSDTSFGGSTCQLFFKHQEEDTKSTLKRLSITEQFGCRDGYCTLETLLIATLMLVLLCTWCRFFRLSCWLKPFCSGIYSTCKHIFGFPKVSRKTINDEHGWECCDESEPVLDAQSCTCSNSILSSPRESENELCTACTNFSFSCREGTSNCAKFACRPDDEQNTVSTGALECSVCCSKEKVPCQNTEIRGCSSRDVSSSNSCGIQRPQTNMTAAPCHFQPGTLKIPAPNKNISPCLFYKPNCYVPPSTRGGEGLEARCLPESRFANCSVSQRFQNSSPPRGSRERSGDFLGTLRRCGDCSNPGVPSQRSLNPCTISATPNYRTSTNNLGGFRGDCTSQRNHSPRPISPCNLELSPTGRTQTSYFDSTTDYRSSSFLIRKYCPASHANESPVCNNEDRKCRVDNSYGGDKRSRGDCVKMTIFKNKDEDDKLGNKFGRSDARNDMDCYVIRNKPNCLASGDRPAGSPDTVGRSDSPINRSRPDSQYFGSKLCTPASGREPGSQTLRSPPETGSQPGSPAVGSKPGSSTDESKANVVERRGASKVTLQFDDTCVTFCPDTKRFVLRGSGQFRGDIPLSMSKNKEENACVMM